MDGRNIKYTLNFETYFSFKVTVRIGSPCSNQFRNETLGMGGENAAVTEFVPMPSSA